MMTPGLDFSADGAGVGVPSNTKLGRVIDSVRSHLGELDSGERIEAINEIKIAMHEVSPFSDEPVDCVLWVPFDDVVANDYNPNAVAPPEMKLLEISIAEDGYTQPIVTWGQGNKHEVVDGFHRNRVGKESKQIRGRVLGHLPVVNIKHDRESRSDRIASTIRHNRARGVHQVDSMSDIVVELKRRNWSKEKIGRELGMDQDEVLRLMQITGLTEMFSDENFSRAWDVEGEIDESDFADLDDIEDEDGLGVRTVNTNDENRVFHTYENWECYAAGFYATTKAGMTVEQGRVAYRDFLSDDLKFSNALESVITEWVHSCEHYLTNVAMNRIAWLGQASVCYELGIPSTYRGGFSMLSPEQQGAANELALAALNRWLRNNERPEVSMDDALSGRQSDIY